MSLLVPETGVGGKETCERHACAELPSSGGDRVKGDDRSLRHTDESDPDERNPLS